VPPDDELLDELAWVVLLPDEEVLDDELLWAAPLLDEEVELDPAPTPAAWDVEEAVDALLPLSLLPPPQAASRRQGNTEIKRGADFIAQSLLRLNQAAILETEWSPA
jgi:hypothetical protein